MAEFYEDVSSSDAMPDQKKAVQKGKETGTTLLIMDLSMLQNLPSEKEDLQVKRLN